MIPDCIDPEINAFLRDILTKSIPESGTDCLNEYDFVNLLEARLHWGGCPACRPEFTGVPAVFAKIGASLASGCRDALAYIKDDFLEQKNLLLAESENSPNACAQILVRLARSEDDVFPLIAHGQEALSLTVSTVRSEEASPFVWEALSWSTCQDFFCSLERDVQHFVFAARISRDLLNPVCERADSEYVENGHYNEDLQQRMESAIANSQLQPTVLLEIVELAAIGNSIRLEDVKGTRLATVAQPDLPPRALTAQQTRALQGLRQEWKMDLLNMGDSLDSLKAGQDEIVRLFEQHKRPATSYEPFIAAQLGEPLYSRLHQMTQRALQLVEYLYNVVQEPDGFAPTAVRMAQGYENELNVRIIGPIVIELLAAGTQTYDAQGKSKEPLIRWGKVHKRGMTLGSWAWYLGKDPVIRSKASERGFDVEAISKDAAWVSVVRNMAAHDFACDRTQADELRRRILCRDGILSRLHPMVATTPEALTA